MQQLRTQKNLTQQQLAEQLYVSRTAISKWESGKGYPNIESLKCISKFFSVSIDELLSGEEVVALAETENSSNLKKIYGLLIGILDVMAIIFIFLPLYGKTEDGYIYLVNLFSFTETTMMNLIIYWGTFIAIIGIGISKLTLTHFNKEVWSGIASKLSITLSIAAVFFFSAAKEPYVTAFLFLFFIMKIFLLIKEFKVK
nr:helix-turn-helix transcriptional regulator [Clostridium niameyense]